MKRPALVSVDDARAMLRYCPDTGELTWIASPRFNVPAGAKAGCANQFSMVVALCGRLYKAHRLAWLIHYGEWPKGVIDHIDGDWRNNRISNLRAVSQKANVQNRTKAQRNNLCGLLGVSRHKSKWKAQIRGADRKNKHLGLFATPELAHAAYVDAKRKLHEGCTL